ncbi:hypothetical protein DF107_15075 [Burkholderia stagnalis]|uniref:Uncharacterized protein n=1 Tax=Burkholderia stagnalis TaxID=1503054 RepID=A0A118MLC8_9BURK|nr:hypothetical protein [Burkholderia stagnalis]KAB0639812.1 hypothetical protein F7R25_07625 [Burkholderia stagnalis]KVC61477.1 hypothetical protein WS59_02840 [Burkholderia stagnalis]KVL88901.1 hypothetical protein WT03_25685 [Burkholderia stagnalis]KVL96907.1 hypothetical protein WT02_14030 [Burkholderia stagnalis]KVM17495.1 hypothetical protein WT04_01690 [Burkholderia stagnalis]
MATGVSVQNLSPITLTASISRWTDGDPGRFQVAPGQIENWPSRTDPRGYIVYLEQDGGLPFYAPTGATVTFYSMTKVTVDGQPVEPLSDAIAVAEALAR